MNIPKNLRRRRPQMESYDQKLEQRAAKHEFLRDRNNVTTCRSPGHKLEADWKSEMQHKRQMEFQRRRQFVQAATPQADEKDSNKETKVTMRTNRQRVPLIHRQSLISAEELGITWPDVHSIRKASGITSPPQGTGGQNKTGQHHSGFSQTFSHTSQQPTLRKCMDIRDRVQQEKSGLVSNQLHQRNAFCQTEHGYITVNEADLLQLAEYLQEALWREDSLKQKLSLLQHTTSTILLSQDNVWKICCKEDRMKVKIGALESQLKICGQRLSRDGAKMLLLQSEQQRQEVEEMAVAVLQRVTDQTNKAQDRAHSLEMALQTAQVQSSQWRERYEEERIKCTQMRKSLVQNIDNINLLQSQLEGVKGQEATLKSQLLQHQHTEAELHLNISLLEHNLHTCRTQDTWRQQQEDTKKQQEIVKGRQQDSIEHPLDEQFHPAMSHHSNTKQSMMETNIHRRERRCCPWFILLSLFLVVTVAAILTLLLADIATRRKQLWELYQVLQERTEKYLYDITSALL
ncbi:TRAF3-interacting JNK-activating modulator isoform X2 [Salmo salar]|uniref:TRAF3-interacting JNK-activating modulator isoform X2 n=1 Tax=Salmo salar TaxID=8030 RepID=A0A1S3LDD9_SALSA|nr:TRAF3-interacting JNK-activating modulator isoform X2 [Salmo salar]